MRGRRPKPVEQHRRDGTARADRHGDGLPVLICGRTIPEPPADLFPEAREAWDAIVPFLGDVGLIDTIDGYALAALAVQAGRAAQARAVIEREGLSVQGHRGMVAHPAVRIEREASTAFLRIAEQYGLTPLARTRLGIAALKRRSFEEELRERIGMNPRATD